MDKKYTYKTILINGPNKWVYAAFPFDSIAAFKTRRAVSVKAEFEGQLYFMSLLPNGRGGHWLHVRKEIRTAIGKEEGDTISISVEKDNSPKTVDIPEYLQWLLEDDPILTKYFEKLPYSAKKFWIIHIEEPKNDDIKVARINRLFEYLKEHYSGKK
jgi:hypothetical protein